MNKSETINELAAALHLAQGQIKHAVKDSSNPYFKSKFADLTSVWDAIRDAFQKNGLSVAQIPDLDGDKPVLVSVLMHKSGQWISGQYLINPVKSDPQGIGSAYTYARRYALQAIAGVCADDDDGEAAHGRTTKQDTRTGEVKGRKTVLDDEQSARLARLNKGILDYGGDAALKKSKEIQDSLAYNSGDDIVGAVEEYYEKCKAWAEKQAAEAAAGKKQ